MRNFVRNRLIERSTFYVSKYRFRKSHWTNSCTTHLEKNALSEITGVCHVVFHVCKHPSLCDNVTSTLIAVIYAQIVDFWKQAPVEYIGVLQTPMTFLITWTKLWRNTKVPNWVLTTNSDQFSSTFLSEKTFNWSPQYNFWLEKKIVFLFYSWTTLCRLWFVSWYLWHLDKKLLSQLTMRHVLWPYFCFTGKK